MEYYINSIFKTTKNLHFQSDKNKYMVYSGFMET